MNKKTILVLLAVIVLVVIAVPVKRILSGHQYQADSHWLASDANSSQVVDHAAWQDLLDEYLITDDPTGVNLVDYESLAEEASEDLTQYLRQLAATDIRTFKREQQFAYWVNLYNALTVKLIVENLPVDSIKDISSSAISLGPWDDVAIQIGEHELTLNDIEHRILRPIWKDHRIHFAVNCASIGCPNLQDQAFTAENTEALLNKSARDYLQHPRAFTLLDSDLQLSSIFDWYQSDFGDSQVQVLNALKPYLNAKQVSNLANWQGKIKYDYDWSLNGVN